MAPFNNSFMTKSQNTKGTSGNNSTRGSKQNVTAKPKTGNTVVSPRGIFYSVALDILTLSRKVLYPVLELDKNFKEENLETWYTNMKLDRDFLSCIAKLSVLVNLFEDVPNSVSNHVAYRSLSEHLTVLKNDMGFDPSEEFDEEDVYKFFRARLQSDENLQYRFIEESKEITSVIKRTGAAN